LSAAYSQRYRRLDVSGLIPAGILGLHGRTGPRAAAFDADGVLWRGDVSEDFTRWMIGRGVFDQALWPQYEAVNGRDPAAGCVEILRFYRGLPLTALRAHVAEFWRTSEPRPWIDAVVAAFRWLAAEGFTMFVVSGTPKVVLEPLVQHLPVQATQIVALELEFDAAGRATGAPRGTVTTGPGKAERLRAVWSGPVLVAAGNSALDVELLKLSTAFRWVVEPSAALRAVAEREGWPVHERP
jgi:HAD superfamily phosphoserine phosphatase-like hydrolase